jgi:GT2 family glycosyltransferase
MSIHPKLTIITVNYNSTKHLNDLIKSLIPLSSRIKKIIVVDNKSNDIDLLNIPAKFTYKIILIKNNSNVGFSRAVNIGINKSKTDILLLLNPDTKIIYPKRIVHMSRYLINHSDIGCMGGTILDQNLKITPSANIFKPSFLSALYVFTNLQKIFPNNEYVKNFYFQKFEETRKTKSVDLLCGAFLMFRKQTGGKTIAFNESYFLYLEDVDFCLDLLKKGFKNIFYPKAKIIHIGGASTNSKYNTVLKYWYMSRKILFSRYLPKAKYNILAIIFKTEEFLLKTYHKILNEPHE